MISRIHGPLALLWHANDELRAIWGAGSHLVLPLGEALVAAAIEGRNKEQEGRHADNGDDEGHAEPVLHRFWWSLLPKLHVADSRLAGKEKCMWQETGSEVSPLSTPPQLGPTASSCLLGAAQETLDAA